MLCSACSDSLWFVTIKCLVYFDHNYRNLCGFCGTVCGSNNEINNNTGSIKSGCEYVYFYSPVPAAKSTSSSPCTNRLINCLSCDQIIWSYNIGLHYEKHHPTVDSNFFEHIVPTRVKFNLVINYGISVSRKSKKNNATLTQTDYGEV